VIICCFVAVSAEFVLTGLSNADGNSRNHEIGVCLPQFTLDLTPACRLSIKPKFASNAFISLTQVGEPEPGKPVIPRATDSIAAINDAVTNKLGYYYLDPVRCPQQYTGYVKGNRLLASGRWKLSFNHNLKRPAAATLVSLTAAVTVAVVSQ
jgi:hypothetical protein